VVRLVLAGGWDERLRENVEHYDELRGLVRKAGLETRVELRRNVSEEERRWLFSCACAVVYTPAFEHFGIVPLEAMAAGRPVIAVGLGGPCESLVHGQTGWLCEPTAEAFADAYEQVIARASAGTLRKLGEGARKRARLMIAPSSRRDHGLHSLSARLTDDGGHFFA
jgi:glycosyltransferase involved in cell wall biosynthesis